MRAEVPCVYAIIICSYLKSSDDGWKIEEPDSVGLTGIQIAQRERGRNIVARSKMRRRGLEFVS